MRKTQFALAAVALIASTAAMAEVAVSGYIDAGVQAARPATGVNTTSFQSGLLAPNTLSFTGSEDMGNGMKATFNLTNRMEIGTGARTGDSSTTVVNSITGVTNGGMMISQVGIAGEFGSINLGKTVDAFWGNGVAAFDVTGGGNMGSSVDAVLKLNLSPVFSTNSIQYVAPSVGGLNVAATYQINDKATNTAALANVSTASPAAAVDANYSITASFASGPVSVGAGLSQATVFATAKGYFVGAGYDLGVAKVNALYMSSKPVGGTVESTVMGANVGVPLNAATTLTAGYYDYDMAGTAAKVTSIGAKYALSKRTTVFANYQHASNAAVGLNVGNSGPVSAGAGSAVTVGVGHAF